MHASRVSPFAWASCVHMHVCLPPTPPLEFLGRPRHRGGNAVRVSQEHRCRPMPWRRGPTAVVGRCLLASAARHACARRCHKSFLGRTRRARQIPPGVRAAQRCSVTDAAATRPLWLPIQGYATICLHPTKHATPPCTWPHDGAALRNATAPHRAQPSVRGDMIASVASISRCLITAPHRACPPRAAGCASVAFQATCRASLWRGGPVAHQAFKLRGYTWRRFFSGCGAPVPFAFLRQEGADRLDS